MSTSTPPPAAPPPPTQHGYYGGGQGPMPISPPNAELIVYVLAVAIVGIAVLASDSLTGGDWLTFSTVATAAYLLSRGLAKMRNVTES